MDKTVKSFIDYLKEQVGQPYLWGGQHTKLTPENYRQIIHRKENNRGGYNDGKTYEESVIEYCDKKFSKGEMILYAYDCSGLGCYWLYNLTHLYKGDVNANTMMTRCEIKSDTPKKGWWVFRLSGKRASHVGYMIDDEYLIEAKGRKYGVVKTKFKMKDWHRWGIPSVFKSEIVGPGPEPAGFIFSRILKYGCKGDDVKELKRILTEAGYSGLTETNPNYRSKTVAVVKRYQKDHGLTADGKAGPETIRSLGGIYI